MPVDDNFASSDPTDEPDEGESGYAGRVLTFGNSTRSVSLIQGHVKWNVPALG